MSTSLLDPPERCARVELHMILTSITVNEERIRHKSNWAFPVVILIEPSMIRDLMPFSTKNRRYRSRDCFLGI